MDPWTDPFGDRTHRTEKTLGAIMEQRDEKALETMKEVRLGLLGEIRSKENSYEIEEPLYRLHVLESFEAQTKQLGLEKAFARTTGKRLTDLMLAFRDCPELLSEAKRVKEELEVLKDKVLEDLREIRRENLKDITPSLFEGEDAVERFDDIADRFYEEGRLIRSLERSRDIKDWLQGLDSCGTRMLTAVKRRLSDTQRAYIEVWT